VFCKRYCCESLIISAWHKYFLSEGSSSKHGRNEEGGERFPAHVTVKYSACFG